MASPIEASHLRPLDELPPIVSSPEPSEERGDADEDYSSEATTRHPGGSNLDPDQAAVGQSDEQFYGDYEGCYDEYNNIGYYDQMYHGGAGPSGTWHGEHFVPGDDGLPPEELDKYPVRATLRDFEILVKDCMREPCHQPTGTFSIPDRFQNENSAPVNKNILAKLKAKLPNNPDTDNEIRREYRFKTEDLFQARKAQQDETEQKGHDSFKFIPKFFDKGSNKRDGENNLQQFCRREARQRKLAQRSEELMDNKDLYKVQMLLKENAIAARDDVEVIDWKGFLKVRDAVAYKPQFAEYFSPAMFYQFDRDQKGCIAIVPFFSYVVRRVNSKQTRISLSFYDTVGSGYAFKFRRRFRLDLRLLPENFRIE